MTVEKKRVAILISGRGSNMAALIEAAKSTTFPARIVGVIADNADAKGLAIASANGIFTETLLRKDFAGKQAHDQAIDATLRGLGAEIVCLAGYMRMLSDAFVTKWQGRMINIHPSILPLFRGLDTHRRTLEAGMRVHGCSVHFVTPAMDEGPIIAQAVLSVLPSDSVETLAARVLKLEHQLYPMVLDLLCVGKARMEGGRAVLDASASASGDLMLVSAKTSRGDVEIDVEALARFTP